MPQPTVQQLHIDRVLTQISVKYTQNAEQFIAAKVFPRVLVDKKSDMYRIYNRNDWLRDDAKPRASLTESAGGGYRLSYGSYMAEVMAFHKDVGPQERANADEPLDMDRDAAEFVAGKLLLRMELQWAEEFFKTGVWGTDDTTAVNWDSYATSNPIGNVRAAKALILGQTGYEPNTLVLGFGVYNALLDHPDIIDRIKYSSSPAAPTMVTDSVLAALFGVERVLVAKAIKATNNEGAAVETYDFAFGKQGSKGIYLAIQEAF